MHQDHLVRQKYDDLRAATDDYLFALESEGEALKTREVYALSLQHFHTFAAGAPLARINATFLRRFLTYLAGRELSATSQGNYLRAMKTWLRWLDAEGGYGVDAAFCDRVHAPERPNDPPKPFATQECEALFRECSKGWMGLRMRAMLAVLLDTGLRASELCGLRLCDVDLTKGVLTIRGARSCWVGGRGMRRGNGGRGSGT